MNYLQEFHEPLRLLAIEMFGEDRVKTVPGHVWVSMTGNKHIWMTFNPFTSAEVMEQVECWLLKDYVLHASPINEGKWNEYCITIQKSPQGRFPKTYASFKHDGTRDGVRKAKALAVMHVVVKKYKLDNKEED